MTGLRKLSTGALVLLGLGPALLVAVALIASDPWLDSLPGAVAETIALGAALAIVVWSLFVSTLTNRRLDEVQRASQRDAWQHGTTAGTIAVAILICLPPVNDNIVGLANAAATALKGSTEKAPLLAFVGGFVTLALAQVIGAFIACNLWWRAKR